jgi:DNA repair protein RadC
MIPSPYILKDKALALDGGYVLKVRDLPDTDKPRERLLAKGPQELSSNELLAILIGSGTVKEDVLSMSARILKEYGEKSLLTRTDAKALATDLDIPLVKAMQIIAAGELGRRFFKRNGAGVAVIRTVADVFSYCAGMRSLPKEHLRGLYLNSHFQIIHDELLSVGSVDMSVVHPREVFKPALEYSAAAVVLVHNHPSGVTTPSKADITVTKQLKEAGELLCIELVDHVIVTETGFESVSGDTD